LALEALSRGGIALPSARPHLIFRLVPSTANPVVTEQSTPSHPTHASGGGLLPTEFQVFGTGFRVRTPIDPKEQPALCAFEALHALQSNRQPQRAFLRTEFAASLRSILGERRGFPKSSWEVVVAPKVATTPPPGLFLLAHERFSERLEFAIASEEVTPASRALRGGFESLGIQELTPTMVRDLATRLASATNRGIISPRRSGKHVIAASIVGVALRQEFQGEGFVAPLEGTSAVTLLGVNPADESGAMAIGFGARDSTLHFVVGYAALEEPLAAELVRGKLTGSLADRCERLLRWIELASLDTGGVGTTAAREALNWLLFPALAERDIEGGVTHRLLLNLGRGTRISTSVLCYLPESANVGGRGAAKLGNSSVSLRTLNVETFEALVLSAGGTSAA
jgi:hypothetical protein